jgi:hypothetical protein
MKFIALAISCALFGAGCTTEAEKKMGGGDVTAPWPALEKFEGEPLLSVGYPAEMGNWAEVKKAASAASFEAAVSEFEQSTVPDEHSDRQAAKDSAAQAMKALIEASKSGTPDDVKGKYEALQQALKALRQPPSSS